MTHSCRRLTVSRSAATLFGTAYQALHQTSARRAGVGSPPAPADLRGTTSLFHGRAPRTGSGALTGGAADALLRLGRRENAPLAKLLARLLRVVAEEAGRTPVSRTRSQAPSVRRPRLGRSERQHAAATVAHRELWTPSPSWRRAARRVSVRTITCHRFPLNLANRSRRPPLRQQLRERTIRTVRCGPSGQRSVDAQGMSQCNRPVPVTIGAD